MVIKTEPQSLTSKWLIIMADSGSCTFCRSGFQALNYIFFCLQYNNRSSMANKKSHSPLRVPSSSVLPPSIVNFSSWISVHPVVLISLDPHQLPTQEKEKENSHQMAQVILRATYWYQMLNQLAVVNYTAPSWQYYSSNVPRERSQEAASTRLIYCSQISRQHWIFVRWISIKVIHSCQCQLYNTPMKEGNRSNVMSCDVN